MTNEVSKLAIDYFSPYQEYFWKWTENGEVIEWSHHNTLCYREDLQNILSGISSEGIPPLSTVLLMLAACQGDLKKGSQGANTLELIPLGLEKSLMMTKQYSEIKEYVDKAIAFLQVVSELPAEYRQGPKRILLLQTVFENIPKNISAEQAKNVVNEYKSGRLDEGILLGSFILTRNKIEADFFPLVEAGKKFLTTYLLELKLRTGVTQVPTPAKTELPEQQTPDLLELLAQDSKTVGITRLTQRLIAALNIPMHSKGISDQSYGGVSDISNRGNFDRLLLSELAHDDISLMARLANNEALYLRREELPSNLDLKRNILIDTTIKMWGTPRLFAVAAALACAQKKKQNTVVTSFAISGKNFLPIDLDSKNGVINALEQLDAAMHCGKGLEKFMNEQPSKTKTENFLITEAESDQSPEFLASISELKKSLNYLITVNRNGELQFYEFVKGSRKLISNTKFELEELLFASQPTAKRVKSTKDIPAILSCNPFPLLYPTSKIRMSARNTYDANPYGVIGISLDQRVLHWPFKGRGAWEVIDVIEKGDYAFGSNGGALIFILVKNEDSGLLKLYQYDRQSVQVKTFDFSKVILKPTTIAFFDNRFHITTASDTFQIDAEHATLVNKTDYKSLPDYLKKNPKASVVNFNNVKKHINNGYSVLNTVKSVFLNGNGNLALDHRQIVIGNNKNLSIVANTNGTLRTVHSRHIETVSLDALTNSYVKFSKFAWTDGSDAWIDSRGFIHLRSSDKNIPEITIVLIVGRETAGWTSDGKVFGSSYFIGENNPDMISVSDFLVNYLQRFLDTLR